VQAANWEPPIDLFETRLGLSVIAALPGVEAQDIAISLKSGMLQVAGQRRLPATRGAECRTFGSREPPRSAERIGAIAIPSSLLGQGPPVLSFLNSSEWWPEKGIKPRLDDRIALARRCLQTGSVSDLHQSATVADEPRLLERLSSKRDRRSISSQDVCEKFVSVSQRFTFCPIMHHEEPTAHPFFYRMARVAGDGLHNLRQQCLRIADEQVSYVLAFLKLGSQSVDGASAHRTCELHDALIEGDPAVHGGKEAKRSLAPNVRGLERGPVLQDG
jgi:hypothetical protein